MSSTNKTPNLELSQWVLSDPFNMADFNEDNAKIDAAVVGIPLIKLMDVTLQEQAATVELDLSGLDMTKYLSLRIYQRGEYKDLNLRVNKISDPYYYYNSSGNWQQTGSYAGSVMGYMDIELDVSSMYLHSNLKLYRAPTNIPAASIVSLDLLRDPSNNGGGTLFYPAGTRFILMGVKK